MAKFTIHDVAKEAKVSTATVSRVLNNPKQVRNSTKKKVEAAIERLGFYPNLTARHLRTSKSKTILAVIPEVGNAFYDSILRGVQSRIHAIGYRTLLLTSEGIPDWEEEVCSMLEQHRVDGVVLLGAMLSQDVAARLPKNHAIVQICDYIEDEHTFVVTFDYEDGTYRAMRYLIELGHKKIAFVNSAAERSITPYRTNGFERAMKEASLAIRPKLVFHAGFSFEEGVEIGKQMFQLPKEERPTAILANCDDNAFGIMKAAKEMHISIPGDVSLMGYNNIEQAGIELIELTNYMVPTFEIGETAADVIVACVRKEMRSKQTIAKRGKVIPRKTCSQCSAI